MRWNETLQGFLCGSISSSEMLYFLLTDVLAPREPRRKVWKEQHSHPLTSAAARAAVGSSSVCRPVAAACSAPAPPAAACAAATPRQEVVEREKQCSFLFFLKVK